MSENYLIWWACANEARVFAYWLTRWGVGMKGLPLRRLFHDSEHELRDGDAAPVVVFGRGAESIKLDPRYLGRCNNLSAYHYMFPK
jgi:hypothetical protein